MDLQQIRENIKNITDYSPELQAYSNQLDDIINISYYNLWTLKRWNFAQKLSWLEAYPDITSDRETNGGTTITATITDGQRLVTFSAAVNTLMHKKDVYEGNIIELDGREYTILQVLSTTTLTTSEPIRILDGVASKVLSNWRAKARFYTLPQDCIEILNLQHRDVPVGSGGQGYILPPYGKTVAMLPRMEESMGLREDYTQTYAEAYVPVPPHQVPAAEKIGVVFNAQNVPANGSIPGAYYIELCWSFVDPTKQTGPLSESFIGAGASSGSTYSMQVSFLTWDDKPVVSKNTAYNAGPGTKRFLEGLSKVLWYNQNFDPATGTRLGKPKWRQVTVGTLSGGLNVPSQDTPIVADDIDATVNITNITSFDAGSPVYKEYDGVHTRIRPYPRIDAFDFQYFEVATGATQPLRLRDFFRRLELRYYFKPEPLIAKTDTPQLPFDMHQLIVYGALEDIYNKSGNLTLASIYARKIKDAIKLCERRYIDHVDIDVVKGQFGRMIAGPIFDQQSLRNKSI